MIGNTIIFRIYETSYSGFIDWSKPAKEVEGLVIDAFTKVTGSVEGDGILGFVEVKGRTDSKRMYKVQYYEQWDSKKEYPRLTDITDSYLVRVVKFAEVPPGYEKIVS